MSRQAKLAKNTFILSIGTFFPKLVSFITLPILTGYLTKAEYGTYDLITVLVSLILPTATLQIQAAAFRYIIDVRNEDKKVKKIVSNIFIFIVPISIVSLSILFFCLPIKSTSIKLCVCLYFFCDILVGAARQVVRGLAQNMEYSISAIVSAVGRLIFVVIGVCQLKQGLLGAIFALCMADLFSLIYLIVKSKLYRYIKFSLFDFSVIKELLEYSWGMVPNSMSMWIMRVSDRFVVTLFMGVSANALYSVANKIPSLLTLAQSTFTMAWQENAAVALKDDDAEQYYSSMFDVMYNLMVGFFGIIIAATPILFKMLIRGNYADAYYQIPILFLGMFYFSMSSFIGGIYVAYKATKSVGITTMCAAVANLVIDLAAIKFIGLYAASGSTLISYLILFIYRMIDVQKFVKIKFDLRYLFITNIIMLFECYLCSKQNLILNIVNLILGCLVFGLLNKTLIKNSYKLIKKSMR